MPKTSVQNMIQVVGMSLIAVSSCLANAALIAVVIKRRSLQTRTNYLIVSLAVSDLLISTITIPLHLLSDFEIFGESLRGCLLANSPTIALPLVSLLLLVVMAADRLVAITRPLTYHLLVTPPRIIVIITVIWCYGLLCALLPIAGWNNFALRRERNITLGDCNFAGIMDGSFVGFCILGHFLPGMIVMLLLYLKIFLLTRSHRRRIGTAEVDLPPDLANKMAAVRRHRTTSKFIIILGHIFLISFIPIFTAFVVDYQFFRVRIIVEWRVPYILYLTGSLLVAINPLVNPILLGFTKKDFRKSLLILFKRRTVSPNTNQSSGRYVTWAKESGRITTHDINCLDRN